MVDSNVDVLYLSQSDSPIPLNVNSLINVSYCFNSRLLSSKKFKLNFTFLIESWSASVKEPIFFQFLYTILEESILPIISTEYRLTTIQVQTISPRNKIKVFRCPLRFASGKSQAQASPSLFRLDLYAQNTFIITRINLKGVVEALDKFDELTPDTQAYAAVNNLEMFFSKLHTMSFKGETSTACSLRFVKLIEPREQKEQKQQKEQKRKIEVKKPKEIYKKPSYRLIHTAVVRGFVR